jgi:putative ABC transport system permease protein
MKWSRRRDPRVRDELRYHRERLIDDYMAAGMDRPSAERRAFLEFGNVPGLEEQVNDVRGRWLDDLRQDLLYAGRTLRRSPGFAAVAILSLALGIGANSAMFSVINAVMLRSLPVAEPDRLVLLARVREGRPMFVPYRLFELFRDHLKSVSDVTALATTDQTVVIDGDDELAGIDKVSGSYFDMLGVRFAVGRPLSTDDDVPAPEMPAAVISDRFWRRRFGGSPAAIGKTVTLRDRVFTIVGVAPPGFQSIRSDRTPDLMIPLRMTLTDEERQALDLNNFTVLARLAPGATMTQANAEVQTLYAGFLQLQAANDRERDRAAILQQRAAALAAPDGFNTVGYDYRRSLLILMGSVGLVLLLGCVNLSGLLLARAAARQREIAIRLAMGAGRGRLVRQFLAESLVLAVLGGVIGLWMAGPLAAWLFGLFLNGREVAISVAPDWRVLAFTGAIASAACILASLAPAVHAARVAVSPSLKEVRARGVGRLGKALVAAQLTISMVLLVGAALFIVSLVKLQTVDRGFDPAGVLVVNVRSATTYLPDRSQAVAGALVDRLRAMPGVRSASAAQVLPVGGGLWARNIQVEGYRFRDDEADTAGFNAVAPGFFVTIGTPFASGRDFDAHDTGASARVAIVNASFARAFFPDAAAVGRHVSSASVTYEIVGVVRDAKYQHLRDPIMRTAYIPLTQRDGNQPSSLVYLVRLANGDAQRMIPDLDRVLRDADPALRLRRARPYTAVIDQSIGTEWTMAMLGGAFGMLAMLVAALGMFGLLAFQVARRTNELGVRMALGASRGSLIALVLRDVAVMVACGVALGSAGAAMTTGLTRALLFGLTPTEPAVFAIAGCALAFTALLAAWLPARRAAHVDPLVALRHE